METILMRIVVVSLFLCCLHGPLHSQAVFVRGDVDGDGELALADALILLRSISERTSLTCADAGDFDDDGAITMGDYGYLLEHLIGGEPKVGEPYPQSGADGTADSLGCAAILPPSVEEGGRYSLSAQQVGDVIRLRVSLENVSAAVGGRLDLKLPAGWDTGSRVAEVRASLEAAKVLGEDYILTAKVRPDGKLTILWILRLPPNPPAFPPGGMRQVMDVLLCPGITPPGDYDLEGSGNGEIVGEDLMRRTAGIGGAKVEIKATGATCDVPFPNLLDARPYFWMGDVEARVGEVFRVPFYSMANVAHSLVKNFIRWDPDVLRVVGVVKSRPESTLAAMFENLEKEVSGGPTFHDIVGHFFRVYYCDPCDARDFVAFFASVRNFHYLGKPRPDLQPGFSPFPALQSFHHMDLILQVVQSAKLGETELRLDDDGGGVIVAGDDTASNHIAFRDQHDLPYQVRPRPYTRNRITILPGKPRISFIRGDVDLDGELNLNDPVRLLSQLFLGSLIPLACPDSADANDDGSLDISDAVAVLGYLFLGGTEPKDPFPFPGTDKTEDLLPCAD